MEKNNYLGGRAGVFTADGFRFDMGPSWYLMPEVFKKFFAVLDENIEDHLQLQRLSPSYRVIFKDRGQSVDIHPSLAKNKRLLERIEPGAGQQLEIYLKRAAHVYDVALNKILYKNYTSLSSLLSPSLGREAHKLLLFRNLHSYVGRYFKDPRLQQLVEFPLVFLGTSPYQAPAFYNLMSGVTMSQGVFYPKGGMAAIAQSLERLARTYGVQFKTRSEVIAINCERGRAQSVTTAKGRTYEADIIVSNTDIHHTETKLLPSKYRDHSERYWQKRVLAPSALLMYLGVKHKYPHLTHHQLVFSQNWRQNFEQLLAEYHYFPVDPSFYVGVPSKTDLTVAPKDHENMFVLVPIAAGLKYTTKQLNTFANQILTTMEKELKLSNLKQHLVYQKLFAVKDFAQQFNSFQGTGLGLAHTLGQTAALRPANQSRKVKNMYYVGADTHPGIGLPMVLISAQLAFERILEKSPAIV